MFIRKKPRKKRKLSWAKRRTRSKNRMIKELDAECRQRVFERDKRCMLNLAQGCTLERDLQWSHIITRARLCVRWEEANSLMACRACHHYWHNNIGQGMLLFQSRYPERWEHIKRILLATKDFGYTEISALHAQTFGTQ